MLGIGQDGRADQEESDKSQEQPRREGHHSVGGGGEGGGEGIVLVGGGVSRLVKTVVHEKASHDAGTVWHSGRGVGKTHLELWMQL